MGDRANVFLPDDFKPDGRGVWLYTHWGGHELADTVREALKRGKSRWSDGPYLARIIFSEMTKGQEQELTGFGITGFMTDNEYPVLVVDPTKQEVRVCAPPSDDSDGRVPGEVRKTLTFEKFVAGKSDPRRP